MPEGAEEKVTFAVSAEVVLEGEVLEVGVAVVIFVLIVVDAVV